MRFQGWRQLLTLQHLLRKASCNASSHAAPSDFVSDASQLAWPAFLLQQLRAAQEAVPPHTALHVLFCRHFGAPRRKSGKSASKINFEEPDEKPEPDKKGRRVNRAITNRFIRVVTEEGHQVMTRQEALEYAQLKGLDLVEVDSKSDPVVCKLMDFKKEKYLDKRREQERRKQQAQQRRLNELKEVRFGTKIEQKDLEMKAENASRLLQLGHKVKCVVQLQGTVPGDGAVDPKMPELLQKMTNMLQNISKPESDPRFSSHRAWVILKPQSAAATVSSSDSTVKVVNSSQEPASVASISEAS